MNGDTFLATVAALAVGFLVYSFGFFAGHACDCRKRGGGA